ncbi:hypothetical protein HK103_005218 [Boothiomyces macroporosus]|uniref:Uncharacterized protein n=1 Tax=Boothiomyces macroporosus TaxID=261099 RepID=A0AAD5UFE1_9FUNG|nr:hypothetical protein HK103_005218 [Boothiomyces macroporosus]
MTWSNTRMRLQTALDISEKYLKQAIPGKHWIYIDGHRWGNTHWGMRCELCARLIKGARYECMECPSMTSFCTDCCHDHDSNHSLVVYAKPIGMTTNMPLAMHGVAQLSECEFKSGSSKITIESSEMVTVEKMTLKEILMVYQALVIGVGPLNQATDAWPSIANALSNVYESLCEYLTKYNKQSEESFLDISAKHFDSHLSLDMDDRKSKRLSFTASLYNRVVGRTNLKCLDETCFYFKNRQRTLFILRTSAEPKRFYRIDLADENGRFYQTDRIRYQFLQAVQSGTDFFDLNRKDEGFEDQSTSSQSTEVDSNVI